MEKREILTPNACLGIRRSILSLQESDTFRLIRWQQKDRRTVYNDCNVSPIKSCKDNVYMAKQENTAQLVVLTYQKHVNHGFT
jgi:hypothetical protein